MREGWQKVNLDNSVVDIIDGDRGNNYPKQDEFFDNGYCWFLNTGNVTVNGFNFEKTQFVTIEKDDLLRKGKLRRNDIVLTTRGTVGNVAYYDDSVPFDNVRINSGMVVLRIDSEQKELYTKYFYHFLKSALFKEQVISHASGSAQPQLPIKDMKQIVLTLPPYETQRRIATILSSLDEKIELNRQTNQTLEAIAQALFKEWFVDFNFPGASGEMQESELGPIPLGWRVGKLGDVCELNPKLPLKKGTSAQYVEMKYLSENSATIKKSIEREFSSGSKFQNGDTLLARITPCLENGKTGLVNLLNDGEIGWGSTEFIVLRGKGSVSPYFVYCLARQQSCRDFAIQSMVGSSGRQRVVESILSDFDVIVPDEIVMNCYHATVSPLFQQLHENEQLTATLSSTRNTLLPKLMSGEIAV